MPSKPSKPTSPHKPLKSARTPNTPKPVKTPDRFAHYVNDWSEEEEADFELGMQMLRERALRSTPSPPVPSDDTAP